MSTTGRIALLVVAAVIAVGAFVLLQPAEEAETPTASTQAAQTTTQTVTATEDTEVATTPETAPEPEPEPLPTLVAYRDGKAVGGVRKLDFDSGDTVTFRLRSDVPEEVHIHGYDKYVQLKAGQTRTVTFKGTLEGVFEIEMHGTGTPVAELRVSPS